MSFRWTVMALTEVTNEEGSGKAVTVSDAIDDAKQWIEGLGPDPLQAVIVITDLND